jgi:6-phosphogluconolactonase
VYQVEESSHTLSEVKALTIPIKAGSGPRHIAFHPNNRFLYVVNELSSELMVYHMASDGQTSLLQTISTLPDNFAGESICAAIKITPDGRFLYVSNRGDNSIAGYRIDLSGKVELISHTSSGGNWPRDLEIDPDGQWILVANQESDNITAFQIQKKTGLLNPMGTVADVSKPVCVKIVSLK